MLAPPELTASWMQSVFFYFTASWQWVAFHALFLFCCAALTAGWRTSGVKWLVLIGHISYANRNPLMTYGVHAVLSCLLPIICFAPVGRALSLDRVREVRIAKRQNLVAHPPAFTSPWAFACTRLMQIQMAVLFFFSGANKLRGDDWWNGDAVWKVFAFDDYYNGFILDLLASQFWLANVATYGTVLIELAYPFLIWQQRSRPYMLAAAIFLHLQFAFLMNLYFFSFVMIMGHMSFLRRAWLRELGAWWKRKVGGMEMIYDGNCGFCKRSMAWWSAADQHPRLPHQPLSGGDRRAAAEGALSRAARRPGAARLRGLSLCRAARARIVVAGSVLLCTGAQPPVRASDLQLDRREPKPALISIRSRIGLR
jgi:HTTM domain